MQPRADTNYEHNPLTFSCFSQMDTSNKSEPVHIIEFRQQDVDTIFSTRLYENFSKPYLTTTEFFSIDMVRNIRYSCN